MGVNKLFIVSLWTYLTIYCSITPLGTEHLVLSWFILWKIKILKFFKAFQALT